MTLRRLLVRSDQMSNILAPDPMGRLATIRKVLEKYANQYDLDWLMLAALGYKESGLNPKARSPKGPWASCSCCPVRGGKSASTAPDSPRWRKCGGRLPLHAVDPRYLLQ